VSILLPGLYVPAETPLHRLDPRVKMAAALLLTVLPFAAPSLASSLLLSVLLVGAATVSAVPLLSLLRTLRMVFWAGLFIFVFRFFTTPGLPLLTLGPVSLTWEGLVSGAQQIFRLCFLVLVSSLLTFTTSPAQLAHGLEWVFHPFTRLGLPVREFSMVLTIALRFVPTLSEEIDKLVKAQESRGALIRSGPPWERMRGWTAVFVPIFVSAFRRADDLATAMESRGFRGARERTHLYELRFTRRDLAASLAILCVGAAVLLVDWYL
jgi:energy-coupling factor transport system permease protein